MKKKIWLKPDDVVPAQAWGGWNISIFGKPKLKVICGNCNAMFKTRDYYPYTVEDKYEGAVACCPNCFKYNKIPIDLREENLNE